MNPAVWRTRGSARPRRHAGGELRWGSARRDASQRGILLDVRRLGACDAAALPPEVRERQLMRRGAIERPACS